MGGRERAFFPFEADSWDRGLSLGGPYHVDYLHSLHRTYNPPSPCRRTCLSLTQIYVYVVVPCFL